MLPGALNFVKLEKIMKPLTMILLVGALVTSQACFADDAQQRMVDLELHMKALTESMAQQIEQLNGQVKKLQSQLEETHTRQTTEEKKSDKLVKASIREVGGLKDGLVLEDGGEMWRLQLNGGVQGDYRHFTPDQQNTDTFSVRYARLAAQLYLFKDFNFKLESEFANDNSGAKGTAALTSGYFEFARWPQAKIRVGQFRPLFGLEGTSNGNFIGFQERSLASNAIAGIGYDRGVMLHGAPIKGTYYSVALSNGTGQNIDNNCAGCNPKSDGMDTTLRARANLAEMLDIKGSVLHMGASWNQGTIAMGTNAKATSALTEARGLTFFAPAAFTGSDVDRSHWGVEGAWSRGPVKLQGEYLHANYDGTSAGGQSYDRNLHAWYVEGNWLVTGENYADTYSGGLFSRIRPKRNFDAIDGWGAFELGVRYSLFDASDFTRANDLGTGVLTTAMSSKADAWTLSANWIFNPFVRVMVNYVQTSFGDSVLVNGKSSDHENALTMRTQFDF